MAATQHSVRIRESVTKLDIMVFESYDGRQNTDATSNNLGLCGDFNRTRGIPAKDNGNTNIHPTVEHDLHRTTTSHFHGAGPPLKPTS